MKVSTLHTRYLRFGFFLIATLSLFSCKDEEWPDPVVFSRDFQGDMRTLVKNISEASKSTGPSFLVVPNNGERLVTQYGQPQDFPDLEYLEAIDGLARDWLFYGYFGPDQLTPYFVNGDILAFLEKVRVYEIPTLITDYCTTPENIDDAYTQNTNTGFVSYSAPTLALDALAAYPLLPFDVNNVAVDSLFRVKNFVNIQQPAGLGSREDFLDEIASTRYDLVITDLFYNGEAFTPQEVERMKTKQTGERRLVLAAMNIGRAESYRYYWNPAWESAPPEWLLDEDSNNPGIYRVNYWDSNWQAFLYGAGDNYLSRIIDAGFDGVFLNGAGAFEYFEELETKAQESR